MLYEYSYERRVVTRDIVRFLCRRKENESGKLSTWEAHEIWLGTFLEVKNRLKETTLTLLLAEYVASSGDSALRATQSWIRGEGINLEEEDDGPRPM